MTSHNLLADLAADRQRTLRAEAAAHRATAPLARPGTLRRALGARLVSLGEQLAGPGPAPTAPATTGPAPASSLA